MALSNRIKIIFDRVAVRQESPRWGPSEWAFQATVNDLSVGDPRAQYPAELRQSIQLPEAPWSHIVDISGLAQIEISFAGTAVSESGNHDLGRVRWVVRRFGEQERRLTNRFFTVTIRLEVEIAGAFGTHQPNAIYASREANRQTIWTTVSGRQMIARLEFCEVRPVMSDGVMPPRPRQPAGAGQAVRNGQGRRLIGPTDPINFIHNPSVIPILTSAEATNQTAACIEWTYFCPRALEFTDNDDRLRWSQDAIDGGEVAFVGGDRGRIIYVRGVTEGEVLLSCRMEGVVLATYRALVRRIRSIPCRCNILNGPAGAQPRSGPEHVQNHMRVANIFLRQLALQLEPNTDPPTDDAVAVEGFPGIFRISVTAGRTRNVTGNHPVCTRLNFRPNVLNIAYIHSDVVGGGFIGLGMASDFSGNTLTSVANPPNRVEDSGSPSTSWIRPSGIAPDAAAGTVRMRVFENNMRRTSPAAGPDYSRLFALYVTSTGNGSPTTPNGILTYGGTIAHEVGHILTLRHRIGAGSDRLSRPPSTNLMHGTNVSALAQDLDIIQARAILGCPLLVPVATVEVSPSSAAILAGGTQQFTATTKDANGNVLRERIPPVFWSSSEPAVATVNRSTGLVTGVTAGSATITATSEGESGTGTVTVAQVSAEATAAPTP